MIKKAIYFLFILISIFLILEVFQRCRYAYRNKSSEPLYYGFKRSERLINIYKQQASFFRQPFTVFEKEQGKNLLFIGGSSTYGAPNDGLHTFSYLLQTKIDGVSCLNAGRVGLSSEQHLDILIRCCKEFCIPDMVVFYTGYNDIFFNNFYSQYKLIRILTDRPAIYSFLILTIKEKLIFIELEKIKDFQYRVRYVKRFEKNLEDCIKFAQSKDIKVVLIPEVLVAERFSSNLDYRWFRKFYLEIPDVLEKLAKEYNCYFLDPKDVLYADWRENFTDLVHLTDKGNKVFSEFLVHNLRFEKNNFSASKPREGA